MNIVSNKRTYHFMGDIDEKNMRELSTWARERLEEDKDGWISLLITSVGGSVSSGFGFIDHMLEIQKAHIQTTALGHTNSMAVPLFMCGERRIVTSRTNFLLHEIGRTFEQHCRWSSSELRRLVKHFDAQEKMYAEFIANRTDGKTSATEILKMMQEETSLWAEDIIRLGLAHEVSRE